MTTRRDFLAASGGAAAAMLGAPALLLRSRATADIIIRNGNVFDGTGAAGRELDVVITGGRIVSVGRASADKGTVEIDAREHAVAPGFIDIHSHGDGSLWDDPRAESLVRQGITTIVVGQDGSSPSPRAERESPGDSERRFVRFTDLWTGLDRLQPSVNVASMVELGTVRGLVVGNENRPASATEMARMRALVTQALNDGACGVSTGLEYTPGAFAPRDERRTGRSLRVS